MTVREIKKWFEAAMPNPTIDNQRVQMGVHFEECSEMFDGITESSKDTRNRIMLSSTNQSLHILSNEMKKSTDFNLVVKNRKALLDALCDQIVTAIGVGHAFGFDILGALEEVSKSNISKFENGEPVFNKNGKITKGVNYIPPNLLPFLGRDPTETDEYA